MQKETVTLTMSPYSTPDFSHASGQVAYNMTNDYLFHHVLQTDKYALKGLISALLHKDPAFIDSLEIRNPIMIGDHISEKSFILDILICFNDDSIMNLEMQVKNLKNWIPRSLSYLCREFDRLDHGDDYDKVKSAYHVGFLDYTLFPDHPEFYATYHMRNDKDNHLYSDFFSLSVIELNHTDMATEEDKAYGIDTWASLFKATTWEEIKMLAQTDPYIESAAHSMYSSVTDPAILDMCRKRDEEIRGDIRRREKLAEQDKQIAEQDRQIAEQDKQIAEQDKKITEQDRQIAEQDKQIAEQDKKITEQDKQITELKNEIAELKKIIDEMKQ
ncbi:conserved hypothetical protein (putative transposase or invertase) [Lachnospiraceae bacterium XBB2008]|nr:conserved hypothetical protein (putative transposase or invertase) [Lachnospiraceae bacterium XBB2008]